MYQLHLVGPFQWDGQRSRDRDHIARCRSNSSEEASRAAESISSFLLTPSVLHSEIKSNSFQAFQPWGNFHGIMTRSWLAGHVSCCALVAVWCIWCFPRLNLVDLHGPMITAGSCCSPSHALHLISWPQDWIGLWAFLEWFACVSLLERCLNKEVVRCKVSSVRELLQLQRLVLEGNSEAEE